MEYPHHTVAELAGSLPMGGSVARTPVHAFLQLPPALHLPARPELQQQRRDIDLGGLLAFEIDNVLTSEEADALVRWSEQLGYRSEAPGISTPPGMRMNKTVHWVADHALLGPIYQRLAALLPAEIDGLPLHPELSHRINMYRYDADDVFNRHLDGDWPGYGLSADGQRMETWGGVRSCLTMLLYLNDAEDGVNGGATRLYGRDGKVVDVQPRKGSTLFFRHGFSTDSVSHAGSRVGAGRAKYVARINVMYQESGLRPPQRRPDAPAD